MKASGIGKRLWRGTKAAAGILVIESDDLTVRGAVMRHGLDGPLCVAGHHESVAMGLNAALAEVLRGLRAAGIEPPARAILLSSQVHSMVLGLPVDPRKPPLPWKQMQEMERRFEEMTRRPQAAIRASSTESGAGFCLTFSFMGSEPLLSRR